MRDARVPALVALVLAACGASQHGSSEAMEPGDTAGEPSMVVLPSLDVPREELAEKTRFGWSLAEESFDVERPPEPPSGETADYQAWSDTELAQWLEHKSRAVEAARAELDQAAEESLRERIIAGAIVGLIYEDVAVEIRGLPIPAEIQSDLEIADVFRSILVSQARPFLEHSRRAYRACAANAEGGPAGMRHWSAFCAGRLDGLPSEEGARARESGETEVEVVRED